MNVKMIQGHPQYGFDLYVSAQPRMTSGPEKRRVQPGSNLPYPPCQPAVLLAVYTPTGTPDRFVSLAPAAARELAAQLRLAADAADAGQTT
jgi:hypothetical protein